MTDKDPKDMTASELLRWAANNDEYISPINGDSWTTYSGKLKSFVELESGDWPNDARLCDCLADKIDAELAQARKEAVNESKKPMWWFRSAIKLGEDWPEPRDGEKFRDYLHRCFLPRPRFEDGEPVQISDMEEIGALATYRVYMDGSWEFEPDKYEDETSPKLWDVQFGTKSERVKRPAPEALGADGLPIVVGETVYLLDGTEGTVVKSRSNATASVEWRDGRWSPGILCDRLTHTPPDTQQRIDDDATLPPREYYNAHIGHDVGLRDDEELTVAMVLDLLRRQRELDKRTGGE